MGCDTCGVPIQGKKHQVAGARYCSPDCAPKWETCKCENPWEEGDTCVRCGRYLTPPDPLRRDL